MASKVNKPSKDSKERIVMIIPLNWANDPAVKKWADALVKRGLAMWGKSHKTLNILPFIV